MCADVPELDVEKAKPGIQELLDTILPAEFAEMKRILAEDQDEDEKQTGAGEKKNRAEERSDGEKEDKQGEKGPVDTTENKIRVEEESGREKEDKQGGNVSLNPLEQRSKLEELDARMSGEFGFERALQDEMQKDAIESGGMDPGYMLQVLDELTDEEREEEERLVKLEAKTFLSEAKAVGLSDQEREKVYGQGAELSSLVAIMVENCIRREDTDATVEWLSLALDMEEHLHGYVSESKADWFEKIGIFAAEMGNMELSIGSFQRSIEILGGLESDPTISTLPVKANYALALVQFDRLENARMLAVRIIETFTPILEKYSAGENVEKYKRTDIAIAAVALWNVTRICSRTDLGLGFVTEGPLRAIKEFSGSVCGVESSRYGQDVTRLGCLLLVAGNMTTLGSKWVATGMEIVKKAAGEDSDQYKNLVVVRATILAITGSNEN